MPNKLQMENNLLNILNPDQKTRKQAVETINRICQENPTQTCQTLLTLINQKPDNQKLLEISSLVIHKNILSKDYLFDSLDIPLLQTIQETLFSQVFTNKQINEKFVRRSAEICVEITIKKQAQQQFVTKLQTACQQNTNGYEKMTSIFILYSLELLSEFTADQNMLIGFTSSFLEYIKAALESKDEDIQIQAALSLTMLMSGIKDKTYLNNFVPFLKQLSSLMIEVIKNKDLNKGIKMVNTFDDLVMFQPKLLASLTNDLVFIFTEIFVSEGIDDAIKIAALNFLGSFAKKNSIMLKKSEHFNNKTLVALYQTYMQTCDEQLKDESEHFLNFVEGALSKKTLPGAITMLLAILSENLSSKYLFAKMMPFCQEGLASTDYKAQQTALVFIGVLSEKTKKYFLNDFDNLMTLILPNLSNKHPKVIFSCLTCLGLLCDEYSPELQTKYGKVILPNLLQLMNNQDQKLYKLNIRAVSCMINFTRELLKNETDDSQETFEQIFGTVFDQLTETIVKLFQFAVQQNMFVLLTEVLSLVSILSNLMQERFRPHYQIFMSNIKQLLNSLGTELNDKQIELRCLLVDTAAFLISSNSKNIDEIKTDVQDLTNYLQNLLKVLDPENQQLKSILSFFSTIAVHLGEFFVPLLTNVFDLALQMSERQVKIHFEDQETFEGKSNNFQSMPIDLKIFGGKKVLSINHTTLEIKLTGFSCLYKLCKYFNKHLSQEQLEKILKSVKIHLSNLHSTPIKKLCCKMLRYILESLPYEIAQNQFDEICPDMITLIKKYFKTDHEEDMIYFLFKLIKTVKVFSNKRLRGVPVVLQPPKCVDQLNLMMKDILDESERLKKELIDSFGDYDLKDPEIKEEFEEDFDFFCSLDQRVMELCGEVQKLSLSEPQSSFISNTLGSYFQRMATNPRGYYEVLYPVCFFTDQMEFGSEESFKTYFFHSTEYCLNTLKQKVYTKEDLIQTIFFYFGCAFLRSEKTDFLKEVENALKSYLNQPDLTTEEQMLVKENAVAALMKIYLKHSQTLLNEQSSKETLQILLNQLPLTKDKEESTVLNRYMMLFSQQNNQFLMGSEEQRNMTQKYLQKLKVEVQKNKNLADEMTRKFLESINL